MDFRTKIDGVDDLDKVFLNLPRAMQNKAYYQALFSGAGIVRDKAAKNVKSIVSSEATGALSKNIRVNRLKKRRGLYRVTVWVRKGAVNTKKKDKNGKPVRIGLYGSVLEYGKKGQPPRSWLRKAIREEKVQAIISIAKKMNENILNSVNEAKKMSGISGRRYKISANQILRRS